MKQFIVAAFLCLAFSALANAAQRKIAYDRGGKIFVANADGTHSKKIAEGTWPEISPDGTRVAFNTEGDAKNRPGPERHIAIADVATAKVTVLPNIPSDNCFGPVWSPDGKQLAFSIMADKASMNGGDRLSVSPDGKALLMDVDCGSEHERKNWDGPQPAIEKLDLTADTAAVRVTGKDDFVWEPFWLNANEFLCIIQKEKENEASIYRMSLDGKNPKLLVKHARTPSASAP